MRPTTPTRPAEPVTKMGFAMISSQCQDRFAAFAPPQSKPGLTRSGYNVSIFS